MNEENEIKREEKLKYGIEESNRWLRHLEVTSWQMFTVLLAGTFYAFGKVIEFNVEKKDFLIFYGIAFFIMWVFFLLFMKDIVLKYQRFLYQINNFEEKIEQDILPNSQSDLPEKVDKNVFSSFLASSLDWIPRKLMYFTAMVIISYLIIILTFFFTVISIFCPCFILKS